MVWVLSQNPILKKHIGYFTISFFLTASPQVKSQTSNIQGMTQIKANCFTMGGEEFVVEEPEHKVCLNSNYLGIYEVAQQKFEHAMRYNPSRFKGLNLPA
jgi:hypothetical protein